jgi:dephospho-CoA kinase
MPFIVALTGGIGSGKSSVADILRELGAAVIDTDEIAHSLTAPGQAGAAAIREQFGPGYLLASGALDRDRMRALVFADPEAKQKLEAILHPMIRAAVAEAIRCARGPYVVIVVPLLIETGAYRKFAQRVLVVDASEEQQIARVVKRSGLTPDAVRAIMASQATRAERLRHADDIVRNETNLARLRAETTALHRDYLDRARAFAAGGSPLGVKKA